MTGTPRQWQSLEHLADTPEFRRLVEREFPAVTDLCAGPDRRQFVKLMAASFALSGLAGCDDASDGRAQEVPYVRNPLRTTPGDVADYATVAIQDGFANGITVATRNGRPFKAEGNGEHPWSRGGTDVFGQASILGLYDPERSQSVRFQGKASSWEAFRGTMFGRFAALRASGGEGLRLLTGPVTSPTLLAQLQAMKCGFPGMAWHSYAAVDRTPLHDGARRAFGRPLDTRWQLDGARVIVALDGDLLDPGPHQVGVSRDWVAARRASAASGPLLALHAAASLPSLTSAKADFPLVATPAELGALAAGLLSDLAAGTAPPAAPADAAPVQQWRARAAAALHAHRGAGLVVAGSCSPPALQEAVHRLNAVLGNAGRTVFYTDPVQAIAEPLAGLVEAMRAGTVSTLILLDVNPSYDAPGGLGFTDALSKVPLRIHAGAYADETSLHCDWHLPLAHVLESWGDFRAVDGTVGLAQPTIASLYEGRASSEVLSLLADAEPRTARDLLREQWRGAADPATFAPAWDTMLRNGFVPGTALPPEEVRLVEAVAVPADAGTATADALEVLIRPDPTVWDGQVGNNSWLQELPKPLTKLVWENVLSVSPALATRQSLKTGDVAVLSVGERQVEGPVWVLPGQADGTVGVTLGYGQAAPGLLSYGLGYNAAVLRDGAGDPWRIGGASLRRTGRTASLATTQDHDTMEGHGFVRVQDEGAAPVGDATSWTQPTLYDAPRPENGTDKDAAWGMVIDLDACIGCNACVVACQSENNIAVVGKEQVALGREMHWLRVDRYYEGPPDAPQTRFQPVPCMHCENAPCEVGCPVEATLHDSEGLNLMVYNRCIGTRACSGYCPYKVRHFNYLDYSAGAAPSVQLGRNPQVTVRARGVMEKCTYCVQRIANARIDADKANRPIANGAVQTACQGACPTQAIVFGDLNIAGSAVATARKDGRNYALLGELNVRPRTSYLAARAAKAGDEG